MFLLWLTHLPAWGCVKSRKALAPPAVREKLESAGLKFVSEDRTTPEYLATFVQSEIAKWAAPIKASGVSVD